MMTDPLTRLIGAVEDLAAGDLPTGLEAFAAADQPEPVRRLAAAFLALAARERQGHECLAQLQCSTFTTVVAMANALSARDAATAGHGHRVAQYAERLARRCGIAGADLERLCLAAELHDIGKIGFPDHFFSQEDAAMTPELAAEIARHPDIAMEILRPLDCLGEALEFIHLHHERLDGRGYPQHKRGAEISRGARIVSIADCFDAITHDRPYQRRKTVDQACAILRRVAGTQLDAELVELFVTEIAPAGLAAESAPPAWPHAVESAPIG